MLLLGSLVKAQDPQSSQTVDQSMGYGDDKSYIYYIGSAYDSIGVGDSIWDYKVRVKSKFSLKPECYFSVDSVGGTADSVLIGLYSKTFAPAPWVLREKVTWYGSADSTNVIMQSDSAHISEYWMFRMTGYSDGFNAALDTVIFKFTEVR